jgi:hypothetical protein
VTFLFVGGEDCDLQNVGGCPVSTSIYRSGFSRCSLGVGSQATRVPQTSFWNAYNVFASNSFWFSARCYDSSVSEASTSGAPQGFLIRFTDALGIVRLQIASPSWGSNSTAIFQLQSVNAAGTVTNLATSVSGFTPGYWAKFDFQINYSTSGGFTWYVDNYPLLSYVGNVTTDGVTQLNGFALGFAAQSATPITSYAYWSEIIVSTVDTRSLSLQTLAPTGAGATSTWSGDSNGDTVNEMVVNDGSGITTSSAGQYELFTQAGTLSAPFVVAVIVSARAMTSPGQPQNIKMVLNKSGTSYTSSTIAVSDSYQNNQYVWTTDPSTGLAWTSISGVQIGIESIA